MNAYLLVSRLEHVANSKDREAGQQGYHFVTAEEATRQCPLVPIKNESGVQSEIFLDISFLL
jgi:hypothetical protein